MTIGILMTIQISPIILEFSLIVPALNRHFIYNNPKLDIVIEPAANWEHSSINITAIEKGLRIRLGIAEDTIDGAVFINGDFVDNFTFNAVDGDQRKANVRKLIDILEGTISYD